jgi:hypothetical protein
MRQGPGVTEQPCDIGSHVDHLCLQLLSGGVVGRGDRDVSVTQSLGDALRDGVSP